MASKARNGRTLRILYALRDAPDGLTAPDLIERLGEGIEHFSALRAYGNDLRRRERKGHVERAGQIPGAYHNVPTTVWRLTGAGRDYLAYLDAAPEREADAQRAATELAEAAIVRAHALTRAAATYGGRQVPRAERRKAAAELRSLGCMLEEIGQVFGVTREMIRQDLLPFTPRPAHAPEVPGARYVEAVPLNGVLALRVGKRTIYLTRGEARSLAEVIGNWEATEQVPA